MRIGVTGIFASGKASVCALFSELGALVIDTDIIAREIVTPGTSCYNAIVDAFGTGFLNIDRTLDRRRFAQFIFSDKKRVEILNNITHPAVLEKLLSLSDSGAIYMVNTPLLFEAKFNERMDKNIVVTADPEQVIERGIRRDGITAGEIEDRLKHQIPLNEKVKMADYVINNSGTFENTKRQVNELWKILLRIRKK